LIFFQLFFDRLLKFKKKKKKKKKKVKSRIRALRSQAEDESLVLRRELDIQIMRYPTRVRQLTVREFERDFAGNVLLASARKVDPTPSYSVLATPRGAVQSVAATPLSVRSQQKRQQLTAAVVAKRTVPAASQVVSHIASSTAAAPSVDKDSAREQIRLLQEQLNGLMASLQSPAGK
jgi:hypothetical protein